MAKVSDSMICDLHSSLRHIMRLCRWAGFFPVEGLNDQYPWRVKFNLRSVYGVYYAYSATLLLFQCFLSMYRWSFVPGARSPLDTRNLILFLNITIELILLYKLAKQWPKLVMEAVQIERDLHKLIIFKRSHVKATVVCYTVLILGLVEHILDLVFNFKIVYNCSGRENIDSTSFENFFKDLYSLFDYIPYNIWFGLLAQLACTQGTFLWSFTDVMGMCFSIYLISYFRDLGRAMNSVGVKDWAKLRVSYSRVVVILNLINEQLAGFILLASISNLFFICLHLFNSLHQPIIIMGHKICDNIPKHQKDISISLEYLAYCLFSFLYLVTRALMFAYLAATVHTSAYKGVLTLYEVPDFEFNREVRCFQMQLRYTKVALSGIFFIVDRKMILRAIATILTYELVLLQFSLQEEPTKPSYSNDTKMSLNQLRNT